MPIRRVLLILDICSSLCLAGCEKPLMTLNIVRALPTGPARGQQFMRALNVGW